MENASSLFKGNFERFLALCMWNLLKQRIKDKATNCFEDISVFLKTNLIKIENAIESSIFRFESIGCAWGLGLTNYLHGLILLSKKTLQTSDFKFE